MFIAFIQNSYAQKKFRERESEGSWCCWHLTSFWCDVPAQSLVKHLWENTVTLCTVWYCYHKRADVWGFRLVCASVAFSYYLATFYAFCVVIKKKSHFLALYKNCPPQKDWDFCLWIVQRKQKVSILNVSISIRVVRVFVLHQSCHWKLFVTINGVFCWHQTHAVIEK